MEVEILYADGATAKIVGAEKGNKSYTKLENSEDGTMRMYYDNGVTYLVLDDEQEVLVVKEETGENFVDMVISLQGEETIEKSKETFNGVEYDCESISDVDEDGPCTEKYLFDSNGELKYILYTFMNDGVEQTNVEKITVLSHTIPDETILNYVQPEGYEVEEV